MQRARHTSDPRGTATAQRRASRAPLEAAPAPFARVDREPPLPTGAIADDALGNALQAAVIARARSTGPRLQRMAIRGTKTRPFVASETKEKHIEAPAAQAAKAEAGYGHRTFVTAESVLIDAVDAYDHDFGEPNRVASARLDINAELPIYQFDKTEPPPDGFKKGKPVKKTIDGAKTKCEIGVIKTGDDRLKIMHFKKA